MMRFAARQCEDFLASLREAGLELPRSRFSSAFTDGLSGYGCISGTSWAVVVGDSVELCGPFDPEIYAGIRLIDEAHLFTPPPEWMEQIRRDPECRAEEYTRVAFEPMLPAASRAPQAEQDPNDNVIEGLRVEIRAISSDLVRSLLAEPWAADVVSNTMTGDAGSRTGFGFVALLDTRIIGAVGCYLCYREGIEVQIDTHSRFRRRGVATRLARRMVEECSRRGLACHWDAMNAESASLARRLGFREAGKYWCVQLTRQPAGKSER